SVNDLVDRQRSSALTQRVRRKTRVLTSRAMAVRFAAARASRRLRLLLLRPRGQSHGERAAPPRLAGHGDVAAEQPREAAGEREPEPGAGRASRHHLLDLPERLEDALEVLGRDADPGVRHIDHDLVRLSAGGEADLAAIRELDRV